MKKRRQSYLSGLQDDHDYLAAPARPDESDLEAQVQRYRDGDATLRDPIIKAHLHIVASIVGDHGHRRNVDEILGEALWALVDAVERAANALHDNAITPYITAVVRDKIRDLIARDRVMYMPARTFREKCAKGEIDRERNDDPIVRAVVSIILGKA